MCHNLGNSESLDEIVKMHCSITQILHYYSKIFPIICIITIIEPIIYFSL